MSAEEFVELMTGLGFGREYAGFLAEALVDVATGARPVPVTDTVARVTGRRPYSVDDFARHYYGSGRENSVP